MGIRIINQLTTIIKTNKMEKSITINKIALAHDMFMKASYTELLPGNDERRHTGVACSAPVHEDLVKAFKLLTPHLALICEQITKEQFIESIPEDYSAPIGYDEESELGELIVKSLESKAKKIKKKTAGLNGTDEKEVLPTDKFTLEDVELKFIGGVDAIKLSGKMQLSTLENLSISGPWVKFNDEYKFAEDMFQIAELLKMEVKEYIINHKYAPPAQPELEFGDGPETDIDNQQY